MESPLTQPDAQERVVVNAAAAFRANGTTVFGRILAVTGQRISFEADIGDVAGAPLEVRVDLGPASGTALLHGTVVCKIAAAAGESSRYFAQLDEIQATDLERWQAWLGVAQSGGTLSMFSGVVESGGSRRRQLREALTGRSSAGLTAQGITIFE